MSDPHQDDHELDAERHHRLFGAGNQPPPAYGASWEAMGQLVEAMRTRPEGWELELLCFRGGSANARFTSATERAASAASRFAPQAVRDAALDALRTFAPMPAAPGE